MRLRSRILVTAGVACLSTGILAGGALAHGGHGSKHGKWGQAALKVQVRGAITALTPPTTVPGSITVSAEGVGPTPVGPTPLVATPPSGLVWTCDVPVGMDVSGLKVTDQVKIKCRSINGHLTTVKLRLRHDDQRGQMVKEHGHGNRNGRNKVEVEVRGTVAPTSTASAIVIDPNAGVPGSVLPIVTCAIGPRTRIKGDPVIGATVKAECKSRNGVLTAKKIRVKHAQAVAKAKAKGTLNLTVPGEVTVSGVTCNVPTGSTLLDGFKGGDQVEIKCSGNPLTLDKIEAED